MLQSGLELVVFGFPCCPVSLLEMVCLSQSPGLSPWCQRKLPSSHTKYPGWFKLPTDLSHFSTNLPPRFSDFPAFGGRSGCIRGGTPGSGGLTKSGCQTLDRPLVSTCCGDKGALWNIPSVSVSAGWHVQGDFSSSSNQNQDLYFLLHVCVWPVRSDVWIRMRTFKHHGRKPARIACANYFR